MHHYTNIRADEFAREDAELCAEVDRQIEFLENAGPADVAGIFEIIDIALDDDGEDPRLIAGLEALRRLTQNTGKEGNFDV